MQCFRCLYLDYAVFYMFISRLCRCVHEYIKETSIHIYMYACVHACIRVYICICIYTHTVIERYTDTLHFITKVDYSEYNQRRETYPYKNDVYSGTYTYSRKHVNMNLAMHTIAYRFEFGSVFM